LAEAQDTYDLTKTPQVITQTPNRPDQAFTPKVGLVYQPNTNSSLFASYSLFTPNSGNTVNGEAQSFDH
jgi:iron complex outermembrane receptor protein